jgi:hypothetical protein
LSIPRWILGIVAGAISVGSVVGFSRNFACAAVPACVLVMVVAALLDRILFGVIAGNNAARDGARLLIALTMGVAIAFIPPFRLTPSSAFRTVFGMPPPPGVTDLTAESRYAGGPGDHVILLSFQADRATLEQLSPDRFATEDQRYSQIWNVETGREWSQFLADRPVQILDHTARGPWISRIPPMKNPKFYFGYDQARMQDRRIIWDADSGFTIVLFGQG